MKYIYLLLSTIFLSFEVSNVNAQILTGNYTINGDSSTQGRNFATFTEAINALNTYGIDTSTGVIFYVATGQVFNERPPALTASGGFLNRIVFTKLGLGDNPKIKPNIPGNNTIFFQGNFGDGVFRIAGADNILIQHIDIDTNGNYINAWEAYDYGYMLLRRNASDACKNVTIQNCKIQLSPSIVHSAGIFSGAFDTTGFAPIVLSIGGRMENVLIKGIEIWDAYHGIQVIGFQDLISPYTTYDQFVTIDSNTINRFGGLATLATGININYVNFATIKNNTINSISTAADIYGIRSSLTYSASYSILNNSISLINSSGVLCAISCTPLGNVTTHNLNISYNKIFNCNGAGSQFFGINASGTFNNAHVSFNQIFNNYNTGLGETYLIRVFGPFSVFNNKIYNNSVFNSLNNATCFPFLCGTSGATSFYNNEIYNITHLGANTGVLIANRSNSSNFLGYNNFIHSLYTPNSTGLDAIRAIELNGATNQRLFFNTIYLDAISNSSFNYGNSALYIHQSNNAEIRNNIIANRSTPGPSGGIVAAYRRSQGSFVTYNFNSNNNCFFVDTNFSRRTIFFNVTDTILNFQAYQTLVGPLRDSLSVFALPPFINILTAPYDLRLSTLTSPVVAAGSPVSTPLITQDIFGNIRSTTNPDIGAYEVS
ncbi:MAG: hypothetical protein Q8R57_09125, partial [Bacteroidota bacterium]|nr:hypothetical protein [Bacteroidota bacterium]